jgi:hypothetical protein
MNDSANALVSCRASHRTRKNVSDPIAGSIAFLRHRIEKDQSTVATLEALTVAEPAVAPFTNGAAKRTSRTGITAAIKPRVTETAIRRRRPPKTAQNGLSDEAIMATVERTGSRGLPISAIRTALGPELDTRALSYKLEVPGPTEWLSQGQRVRTLPLRK